MKKISLVLKELNILNHQNGCSTGSKWFANGKKNISYSPVNGEKIAQIVEASKTDYKKVVLVAKEAFVKFRKIPAPIRGDVVRQFGNSLREKKELLGHLVSWEMGKSLQEGLGEVQEMIDICDFAQGLSRQLHGLTMHSERFKHRMYEQYHPLGIVGIISAFNFPVAVWSWNVCLAWVCGNVCVWKPSEKTPLSSIACQKIINEILVNNKLPEGVSCLVNGGADIGKLIAEDKNIQLVSATGSTKMGKDVASIVGKRLGKTLLELGGNNAVIVSKYSKLDLVIKASVFGAVGTCGQRCTSTRRLIVHDAVYEKIKKMLIKTYNQLKIGNPINEKNHLGPLIDKDSMNDYFKTIEAVNKQGGKWIVEGGEIKLKELPGGYYVKPAIAEINHKSPIVQKETFAPILFLIKYSGEIDNAINIQNDVSQGLSSAIISENLTEVETFLSHWGSDCGIANVNIGTSGAEIGGAFGGEKDTGGGRESGSDAWKVYMRRQTNTINFSGDLPLAQGIKFDI